MTKSAAFYRGLPYTRRCTPYVEDATLQWHAWIEELPGCEVDAAEKAAAFADLQEVFEDYIQAKLEWGSPIPEPTRWPNFGAAAQPPTVSFPAPTASIIPRPRQKNDPTHLAETEATKDLTLETAEV